MDSLPIQYLHLETAILPFFLGMTLLAQLSRSTEPGFYIPKARLQMVGMITGFFLLTLAFFALLGRVSPLLAVELSAGVILSLLHPVNALCFLVHLLYLRPWEIVTANHLLLALPRGAAMLCFFVWLVYPKQHGKPNTRTLHLLNLLLAYSLWLFLSTFFTVHPAAAQIDWLSTYFKSLILFVLCLFFIDSPRSFSQFKLTLVFSALALMLVRLIQVHTAVGAFTRLQTAGLFGDSNDVAAVIVMTLPFALLPVFNKTAGLGRQLLGLVFGWMSLLVIWYAQSRGAMLALAIQLLTVGIVKTSGKKWFGILFFAGLVGVGYVAVLKSIPRESTEMMASSDDRITYWKTAMNMTVRHPLLGVGYNQYPSNYNAYRVGPTHEWGTRAAHSSWLLAFAEAGIPGGVLFISFFWIVLKTAWRHRAVCPDHLYSLVGTGVVMSFLSHTYGMDIYLLAGLIMACDSVLHPSDHG